MLDTAAPPKPSLKIYVFLLNFKRRTAAKIFGRRPGHTSEAIRIEMGRRGTSSGARTRAAAAVVVAGPGAEPQGPSQSAPRTASRRGVATAPTTTARHGCMQRQDDGKLATRILSRPSNGDGVRQRRRRGRALAPSLRGQARQASRQRGSLWISRRRC